MNSFFPQSSDEYAGFPVVLDTRVVTGPGGGPDKTILNSPRYFTSAGYRMICAYMHPPGDKGFDQLRSKALACQAPLISVPDRGPWDWQVVAQLVRICRRERVRIWHGHDYKSNALGLMVKRFWPMRLVSTVHGWVSQTRRTPIYYLIDKLCLRHYEAILCVSSDLHRHCISAGVPPSRCRLIENGIDTQQFRRRRTREEAKSRLGIAPQRQVVGAVGRLAPEKGFDHLIHALHALVKRGLDVELHIAGEGNEQGRLETLSASLDLANRVRFLGHVADPRDVYEALDIFALSSLREGLPNVLLEALALEVPVTATRIAGVPDLIHDGETGLLVEPGNPEALAAAMERLLLDDSLRIRIGRAGRALVESRYDFANRISKIGAIYDALLKNHRHHEIHG